jgi:hypothetical protein
MTRHAAVLLNRLTWPEVAGMKKNTHEPKRCIYAVNARRRQQPED